MAGSSDAQKRWELENTVQNVEGSDAYYVYDGAEQQALQQQKPWTKDPHYFKQCVSDHKSRSLPSKTCAVPLRI